MYAIQRMYYKFALFIIVQAGSMRCNPASAWLPCFALEVGRWVFRRKTITACLCADPGTVRWWQQVLYVYAIQRMYKFAVFIIV